MVQFTEAWEPGKQQFTVNDVGSAATTLSVNGLRVGTVGNASSGVYTDGGFWYIWPYADSSTTYVPPTDWPAAPQIGRATPGVILSEEEYRRRKIEEVERLREAGQIARQLLKGEKEANPTMQRGLYEVYVVEPESGAHWGPFAIIAKDEVTAKIKAFAKANVAGDVEDYDIIVRRIGDVRAKRERPVKVEVVQP